MPHGLVGLPSRTVLWFNESNEHPPHKTNLPAAAGTLVAVRESVTAITLPVAVRRPLECLSAHQHCASRTVGAAVRAAVGKILPKRMSLRLSLVIEDSSKEDVALGVLTVPAVLGVEDGAGLEQSASPDHRDLTVLVRQVAAWPAADAPPEQ